MIRGVLRNKYALSEDQLTSTVWGLLELLPSHVTLDWIACARPWGAMSESLRFDPHARTELFYWPPTRAHGEPDLLLLVEDGERVDAVLVEAKHGAGKSQWDALEEELAPRKHDQLVRYWSALREQDFAGIDRARLGRARCTVVYLTPHVGPPRAELDESVHIDPSIRLAWLSWRDLHSVLAAANPSERTEERAIGALRALLSHLGLSTFAGFRGPSIAVLVDPSRCWRWDGGTFVGSAHARVHAERTWKFGR